MAAVWYTGPGDRTITTAQWASAGVAGAADTTWNAANGWSLPAVTFNASQLVILAADTGFNINGADGPRPGAVVAAGANPAPVPADGQGPIWSASLGQWVYATPGQGGEVAYAANITNTVTTFATAGGLGTAVDIPGCSISVPVSLRPVVLEYGVVLVQNVVSVGEFYLQVIETTGGANTSLQPFVEPLPQQSGTLSAAQYLVTIWGKQRLGATVGVRTFKLQGVLYTPASITGNASVLNGSNNPSFIAAVAR